MAGAEASVLGGPGGLAIVGPFVTRRLKSTIGPRMLEFFGSFWLVVIFLVVLALVIAWLIDQL
jgi:hypothetical protein